MLRDWDIRSKLLFLYCVWYFNLLLHHFLFFYLFFFLFFFLIFFYIFLVVVFCHFFFYHLFWLSSSLSSLSSPSLLPPDAADRAVWPGHLFPPHPGEQWWRGGGGPPAPGAAALPGEPAAAVPDCAWGHHWLWGAGAAGGAPPRTDGLPLYTVGTSLRYTGLFTLSPWYNHNGWLGIKQQGTYTYSLHCMYLFAVNR